MEIKFGYVEKKETCEIYWFQLITDELIYDTFDNPSKKILSFYTFDDMSGFKPHHGISDPRDFITLGMEILINKKYIRSEIDKQIAKQKTRRKMREAK